MVFKVLLAFAFVKIVLCGEALLEPCLHTDIECLKVATQTFLSRTSAGMPDYGIKPLDPMELKHVEYADPDSDIVMHFKNIKITGLKNMQMNDFQMDTATKSVVLQTKIDSNIASDLTVELKEPAKFLSGTYTAKASVLGTATYTYDLKPNAEGVEYFDVGPETITCEADSVPEVTIDQELADTIANDPDAVARKADYEKRASEIRKKAVCKIIAEAYSVAISNIRASAKNMPKTAFFKDI